MSDSSDCVFCKIVAGQIPCFKLHEDERTIAFMDINPASAGHCLCIPKAHSADLHEIDAADLAATALTAKRVARAVRSVVAPAGMNLFQANGEAAGQSVFHFHVHVLPRAPGDDLAMSWGSTPGDMSAIGALAERIRAAIE